MSSVSPDETRTARTIPESLHMTKRWSPSVTSWTSPSLSVNASRTNEEIAEIMLPTTSRSLSLIRLRDMCLTRRRWRGRSGRRRNPFDRHFHLLWGQLPPWHEMPEVRRSPCEGQACADDENPSGQGCPGRVETTACVLPEELWYRNPQVRSGCRRNREHDRERRVQRRGTGSKEGDPGIEAT